MRRLIAGKYKKVVLGAIAVFFAFSNYYFFSFLTVNQAQAMQVVIDPTQAAIQIPWKGFEIANYSKEEVLNDLKATFFKNVVANLARQFAKASAKWIVSGGKGNKPFWETDVFGSIVDAGQAAFEDWLTAAISNSIGLDLCKFDPTLTLNIALTQPNKPDKIAKQKSIIGGGTAQGCSFEDLKEKFSTEGKDWQDFVKIKATEIGPDTTKNIQQLSRDISNNQTLKQNNAGVPSSGFQSPPPVLTYLNTQTNNLGVMNNNLNNDIDKLIAKKGTNETVELTVGSYPVSAEYINDIKSAWNKKISAGKTEAATQRTKYSRCRGKDLSAWLIDPCATTLKDLGYTPNMPDLGWIKDNPDKAQVLAREIQAKLENVDKMYNSLSIGYDSLSKFVNQQIKPEMFQSAGLYTWQKAKTQFEPQADPATSTSQQVASGSADAKTKAEERKKTEVSTAGGWKGSVEKISGYIKTPADILKAKTIESLSKEDSALEYTKSIVADSLGVFLTELQNLYVQQLLMALSNPKQQRSSGSGSGSNKEEQGMVTEEGVNLYYESLSQGFNFTLPDLDLLQEFQTTITGKKINPNIYNNVIDLNFALAIQQRMTISDALTQGKLNGNARFSAAETLEPNTYNLSNLRKLRKARVIPLGLELAAELIRDCNYRNILDDKGDTAPDYNTFQDGPNGYNNNPANFTGQRLQNCFFKNSSAPFDIEANKRLMQATLNATLNDVVNGFDLRGDDGICGTYDNGESPFCNLVDPEWVLKLPATKCLQTIKNEAYGEILQDNESGSRYSRCADFVSCLANDTQNSCQSADYGVCVKEKNVWRLSGDSCESQYDSCRAYTAIDSNGKKNNVAYLKNTLDPAGCGADTIGCKGYTRNYDNNKFYFNNNVQTCQVANDGCHEFISDPVALTNYPTLPAAYDAATLATRIYYKINPACTPTSTDPNCANYMQTCTDEQIGCALYKPVSGGPTVSAVIKQADQCPAECNGFSAFFRQPTNFEPAGAAAEIDYFVANTARTCPAASVGCSQFTNLDLVAQGGEGIEYYTNLRQCIKPGSGLGEKTYFTWQNIANGPPQLIKYVLQDDSLLSNNTDPNPDKLGAPKTYDGIATDCDPDTNNNCLTFYDSAGKTFLRDVTKTIIVTDDCHPYRKTTATQTTCELTNGKWENNVCIYNAVANLSKSCSAADSGCYLYLGSSGRNVFTVVFDDFESGALPAGYDTTTGVSISGASYTAPGNSLEIAASGSAVRTAAISSNNYYVLGFLAKGSGKLVIPNFGEVTLTDAWVDYTLGPIAPESNMSALSFINQTGSIVNIDNVKLIQEKANYLIKDSWSLPACTFADLNCEAYLGPKDQTFYLKSFSSLCPENKVGCQYLLDTRNTLSPQAQDYTGVLIPADKKVAYVVDTKYKCAAEFKGCEKFTEPVLSGGGVVYDTTYLLNDPETYLGTRGILCQAEAEGCTELINEKGYSEYYKIDPTKICQYTQNYISALSQNVWGWYVAGASTITSCQGTLTPPYNVYSASDALYSGYTATCPIKMSGCSGFQTINSNAPTISLTETACLANSANAWIGNQCVQNYYGQTYFVLDKENNIDRSSCTGVDWNKGCVAFKNNAANEVQTVKVQKDRDCAEWVDCVSKDDQGNCIKMVANYLKPDGSIDKSKEIVADNYCNQKSEVECTVDVATTDYCIWSANKCIAKPVSKIQVSAEKDKVRYGLGENTPLVISRKTYSTRFTNPNDRWDIGDYSGYTIPDRYPLETEILKKFTTYPLEKENLSTDQRFSRPVCKVFAEEDSPVPYEVTRKSGYSKIQNLYSQTVTASDIADACNYDTVETEGVKTFFPFAYFASHLLEDDPQICTGVPSLNGKLCQGAIDNLDKEPKNAQCKSSSEQKNAWCRPIETIKTNFGIQGRCLEMDLLNPLYGGVQKGSYACLSYFPFQYNECGALSGNKTECERLPACSYVNNQCVAELCQFYKTQSSCENTQVTAPNGESISQCLWDGGANGGSGACLFKKCTLSTVTDAASCKNLAPYCQWYSNRCVEDICVSSYSLLSENGIVSHPEPDADLCMNLGDQAAVTTQGDLYNQTTTGKGDYCVWQARNDPNPDKHGRWQFSCQLKCDIKYPYDDLLTNKDACNDDKYCQWSNPVCYEYCFGKNRTQCTADAKCGWDVDADICIDKCKTFIGDTVDQCVLNTQCSLFSGCTDSCSGKTAATCTGVCIWNGTACLDICQIKNGDSSGCTSVTDGGTPICSYNPSTSTCNKIIDCYQLNSTTCRTDLGCNWQQTCHNSTMESYNLIAPGIVNKTNVSCSVNTTEDICNGKTYCAWGLGSCATEKNLKGCEVHAFAVTESTLANKGADCRLGIDKVANTADDCGWWRYTYSNHDKNIGCFPKGYTETCYECLAPQNSNTCHDPGC